jgi:hypothetical protein
VISIALTWLGSSHAQAATGRERAIEQIPELMGRILESQEEIRERASELEPVVERYDAQLSTAKQEIDAAGSESQAAEALVDYVEAYSSRLEAQEAGLRAIESAVVRMRADARELMRAAEIAVASGDKPEDRHAFFKDQFHGIAAASSVLAERLQRQDEAATTGAVLHAGWASHTGFGLELPELGRDGMLAFARKVEGLYARYQARSNQLRAERRSVRGLLDMLIERQLAQRLDSLFSNEGAIGLGGLLSGDGKSQDWQDLGQVVARTLGLPSGGVVTDPYTSASLDRLEFFARGEHRR